MGGDLGPALPGTLRVRPGMHSWMVVSDPLPYVYLEGRLRMKEALRRHQRRALPNAH